MSEAQNKTVVGSSRGTARYSVIGYANGDHIYRDGEIIAICTSTEATVEIIDACNSYDALRERCEALESIIREMLPDIGWNTMARWHPSNKDGQRLIAIASPQRASGDV